MQNQDDHSHGKNFSNFKTLCLYVQGAGPLFNPSSEELTLAAMDKLIEQGTPLFDNLDHLEGLNTTVISDRQAVFTPLKPLFTRIKNSLEGVSRGSKNVEQFETINRKMQGARAIAKTEEGNHISVSQQGFDEKIEHVGSAIGLLSTVPTFKPNEADITVPALKTLKKDLETKHDAAKLVAVSLKLQIDARNAFLYTPDTGLVDIALRITSYCQSAFGSQNPLYKRMSKLSFVNRIKIDEPAVQAVPQ